MEMSVTYWNKGIETSSTGQKLEGKRHRRQRIADEKRLVYENIEKERKEREARESEKRRLWWIIEEPKQKKRVEEAKQREKEQLWERRYNSLLKFGKATRKKELGSYVSAAIDPTCWKCKRTIERGEITWSWYYRETKAGYTISEQHAMFLCLECILKDARKSDKQ
jgi:electron transfer flavoprotein alpha subunit